MEKLKTLPEITNFIQEKNDIFTNLNSILYEFVKNIKSSLNIKDEAIRVTEQDYKLTIIVNSNYSKEEILSFELIYDKNYFLFKNLKFKQQAKRFYLKDDYQNDIEQFLDEKIIKNKKWQSYFYLLRKSLLIDYPMNYDFTEEEPENNENGTTEEQ